MIREQRVPVHEIQIALIRMGASRLQVIYLLSCLQTQQVVQPLLDRVVVSVPDGFVQGYLLQLSPG